MFKVRIAASLLLALTITQTLPCWSLGLGRRQNVLGSFITAPNDKLSEDGEPETQETQTTATKPLDLSPMSLDGAATPDSSGSDGNYLKSTVTETDYVPKGQDAQTKSANLSTMTVGEEKKKGGFFRRGLLKQAKDVNVMPLPLIETAEETAEKTDMVENAEKTQLADLWEAALGRSPDIQFVIQKLMPTSDPGHAATVMMKMLSTVVYGGMNAATMVMPGAATYAGTSVGASMMMNLINGMESKNAKKAQISQEQQIMLYKMVRDVADRMVDNYRTYKRDMISLSRSLTDLSDLQAMISEARQTQDAAKQIEMEYTLRKAQRDVDVVANNVKHHRQSLIDLSGPEAVSKLDKQLDEEQKAVEVASPVTESPKEKVM